MNFKVSSHHWGDYDPPCDHCSLFIYMEDNMTKEEVIKHMSINRWISVNDRLPDKDENYIVTVCDEDCFPGEGIWYSTVVVVAEYYKGGWIWYDGGHEYSLDGIVTHWQPMPEPPEM